MKRKFSLMWRVAITLVMVLSLGLVTVAPVVAQVSSATVTVNPTTKSDLAEYTITFTAYQGLAMSVDDIRVEFPSDTTVPAPATIQGNVTINGNTVTALPTVVSRLVTLKVPADVPVGSVTVVFALAAGIKNPSTAGSYNLKVSTSHEVDFITSSSYTIALPPPTITGLAPPKANQGETLDVFITGTNFTGASAVSFGSGITVSFTVVDAQNITAGITIAADADILTRDVTVTTPSGADIKAWFEVLAAGTALVDVYNGTPAVATYVTSRSTIQAAINDVTGTGWHLIVHADTYTEDLDIPAGKNNLEIEPTDNPAVTIKGVATFAGPFPDGIPNIEILASGVKIHGFTIESPDAVVGRYSSGMFIGASDVEIYDNAFKTHTQDSGQYSVVIQTWRYVVLAGVDISGLDIHDNTFDDLGDGTVGYDGIYVNIDTGALPIAIEDNVFTGSLFRAITVERSNVVISGNTIITDLAPYIGPPPDFQGGYQGMFIGCFPVDIYPGPTQTDVSITGNNVKGATASDGFAQGIRVGHSTQVGLEDIVVSQNTVSGNDEGITVRADASGVTVKYNDVAGNTVGVQNDDAGVTLNAKYNWWGHISGPSTDPEITTTPTVLGQGVVVSTDAIYDPWLTRTQATAVSKGIAYHGSTYELQAGWNTFSVPLALDDDADTLNDIVALGDFVVLSGVNQNYLLGYYYTGAGWVTLPGTHELKPGEAVYVRMKADADFPILFSGVFSVPSVSLSAGWNLIGSAFGVDKTSGDYGVAGVDDTEDGQKAVNVALASLGDDASVVISPSMPGQKVAWATVASDINTKMIVGEGYWVFMTAPATLAGFEVTPIYWINLP